MLISADMVKRTRDRLIKTFNDKGISGKQAVEAMSWLDYFLGSIRLTRAPKPDCAMWKLAVSVFYAELASSTRILPKEAAKRMRIDATLIKSRKIIVEVKGKPIELTIR